MHSYAFLSPACSLCNQNASRAPCETSDPGLEEGVGEIPVELRGVGGEVGPEPVEDLDRQAVGVGGRLEHQRRYRAHQHGLGDPCGAVAAYVAGHLPAAGRVADHDGVVQVELLEEPSEVV